MKETGQEKGNWQGKEKREIGREERRKIGDAITGTDASFEEIKTNAIQ